MREVHELILKEKLKDKPNKKLIQWLQNLNEQIIAQILINEYLNTNHNKSGIIP